MLQVLICARLLRYMLTEALSDAGREWFALEVVGCLDDEEIQALANLYKDHFIRCFRSNKGHTPIPTRHLSAPSSETIKDEDTTLLEKTPQNLTVSKRKALIRDNYSCLLTGKLDSDAVHDGRAVYITALGATLTYLISPQMKILTLMEYAASAHAVLERFGQIRTIDELNGTNVHRPENILTLDTTVHGWLDRLHVWLERKLDDPVNTYRPAAVKPFYLNPIRPIVQLTTPDANRYPLPNPRYIAIHAPCVQVAHLSGTGEYIERIFHEMEDI